MGTILRWGLAILFAYLAVSLVSDGIGLLGVSNSAQAVPVSFMSLEINNQVNPDNIVSYAVLFFAAAVIVMLLSLSLVGETFSSLRGGK
ncbi:hypothetical protein [Oceanobacillus damuensis]|uniref:hypothetical protein n=1 Tax=Oceanobacillus damuensis TaxID=937928 RepID=UPI0008377264|nr:hypothetical protein [Oceanobacillus damuensis]